MQLEGMGLRSREPGNYSYKTGMANKIALRYFKNIRNAGYEVAGQTYGTYSNQQVPRRVYMGLSNG